MTPEEIQRTIEGMLSVQLGLQNSQLKLTEAISDLRESVSELRVEVSELRTEVSELRGGVRDLADSVATLAAVSQRHERRIEQLIGYSISGESDHLDVVQRVQNLERRVNRLEQDQ